MRFYLVAHSSPEGWRRRIRFFSEASLLGCIGDPSGQASKHLSAVFSEVGIPNRWLSLRRRPHFLEETLSSSSWEASPLYAFLKEVPILVLDAEEAQLRRLWQYLHVLGVVRFPYFLPAHRIPAPLNAHALSDLETWAAADERLHLDVRLAASWLPCTLIPTLP